MARRASHFRVQNHLTVDYYRIRRKLAYPLPLKTLHLPFAAMPRGLKGTYPWGVFAMWAFEERVMSLGWHVEWSGCKDSAKAVLDDLDALASWPAQHPWLGQIDLTTAFVARTMAMPLRHWSWLEPTARHKLREGLSQLLANCVPHHEKRFWNSQSVEDLSRLPNLDWLIHNTPIVVQLSLALAADVLRSPTQPGHITLAQSLLQLWLERRTQGAVEGLGYDGMVLDFALELSATAPNVQRILTQRPALQDFVTDVLALRSPAAPHNIARLGDVEPEHMSFYLSASARLAAARPEPELTWHLRQVELEHYRADGLAALVRALSAPLVESTPATVGARSGSYALSLCSGWTEHDTSVVIGCSTSPWSHIHNDTGSVVISHGVRRWICDAGAQQWLNTSERTFTIGPDAHNAPLINQRAQDRKPTQRLCHLDDTLQDKYRAVVDMTACYPPSLGLALAQRTVWLLGNSVVVIADQIEGTNAESASYRFHGHPDAAWFVSYGRAMLTLDNQRCWIATTAQTLTYDNLERLRGSRGQMTLTINDKTVDRPIWWLFEFGRSASKFRVNDEGTQMSLRGTTLSLDHCCGGVCTPQCSANDGPTK